MDPKAYWVGFNLIKGIGAVRFQALRDYFGNLEIAWNAPISALREAGLPEKICERIAQVRKDVDLELYMKRINSLGIDVLISVDPIYPRYLREIDQPPPVLYVKGALSLEDEWAVAIVGTRKVTHYGKQVTEEFSRILSDHNITIVSGLARGVDGIAHKTAIETGGRTIAVLGSGVDRIYPSEHRALAEQIAQSGAVISDYPPGTAPEASNFPPRNRIISGIARATLVIEAGHTSGALITAEFAVNQGRNVYAVPGSIYNVQSKGTNRLIQQGAKPLVDIHDLLQDIQVELIQERKTFRKEYPVDLFEEKILRVLSEEPLHVDEITNLSELPISQVSSYLAMMELKGLAKQVGGMKYKIIREESGEYIQ
jgi:DNA processing protein